MCEAVLLIGLQGAGKSTFYRIRFSETHLRINLDEQKTRHREKLALVAAIRQKLSFVVDNTNATPEQRARFIVPAKKAGYYVIGYFFVPDVKRALEQNAQRTGSAKIHPAAIYGTRKKMQSPQWSEGFDFIYHVTITPTGEYQITETPRSIA